MKTIAKMLMGLIAFLIGVAQPAWADPNPFNVGDLFVAIGNGKVQHRDSTGFLLETLDTLQGGFTTGMAFDAEGSLYVTNFGAGNVVKFNNKGQRIGIFGNGYSGSPESIVFSREGKAYVGSVSGDNDVRKFDPQGTPLGQFNVATDNRGSDWIDLAADQCTLFYTSEGSNVKRFDVCNNTQLPNFNVAALPGSTAFALRLRPGKDVLVANANVITRLDAAGNFVRSYDAPGQDCWFALNLDPDGKSFWSADFCTANVYKFDIETGQVLLTFNTGTGSSTVFGLVVYGEVTAAAPPPTPSVRQEQQRPAIQALLSVLGTFTALTPTRRNAVVLTHGWNSNVDTWPLAMATRIRAIIDDRQQRRLIDPNVIWDVYYVDWRAAAGNGCFLGCFVQWNAYVNAGPLGIALGQYLLPKKYDHIHFIGHSAGSNLIESAATFVRPSGGKQPTIHSTFLDAYHPFPELVTYGVAANWAEQYVDKRDSFSSIIGLGSLRHTNLTLPSAFNFVIDALDKPPITDSSCTNIVCAHAWPYHWYRKTVDHEPFDWLYGFPIAIEYRGGTLPDHQTTLHRGDECSLLTQSSLCTSGSLPTFAEVQLVLAPNPWSSLNGVTAIQSNTGSVSANNTTQGLSLTLTTGSPVWVSLASNVPEAFNTLQFDYRFTSRAEGLLSVFLDDQVVFKADELQVQAGGVNPSGRIAVGNVAPGQHTLSFRLDHFTNAQSSVEISNIAPSVASIIRVVNQKPIASAGTNQTVRLGSLVHLDGSRSSDPDKKPLPLTFNWTQTSGPSALLFDPATARPKFTPSSKGAYVFSLLVNDGQSNSDPARVTVTVPMLGDIDLDGDVDGIDISLVARAVGTNASGPNDLKDINGDGVIDDRDVSALAKMCARAFCATK